MQIIERTKRFLNESGMTQMELANHLGIGFTSLNRLLNGRAGKVSLALKLDAFLDGMNFYPTVTEKPTPSQPTEEA